MRHAIFNLIGRRSSCFRNATLGLALAFAYSAPAAADPAQASKPAGSFSQLPSELTAQPPHEPIPEEIEAGHTILDGMVECDKMAARLAGMKKLVGNLEKASGFLDKLGTVMTSYTIAQHANDFAKKGEIDGLVDDAQGFISEGFCKSLGPYCPVYKVGMGAGTVISYAPKVFGWTDETLNDMWTGYWADVTTGTTKNQLDRKIAEFRAKIEQAKRDARNAEARNAQCKAAPKTTAVDELLNKARGPQDGDPRYNPRKYVWTPVDGEGLMTQDALYNDGWQRMLLWCGQRLVAAGTWAPSGRAKPPAQTSCPTPRKDGEYLTHSSNGRVRFEFWCAGKLADAGPWRPGGYPPSPKIWRCPEKPASSQPLAIAAYRSGDLSGVWRGDASANEVRLTKRVGGYDVVAVTNNPNQSQSAFFSDQSGRLVFTFPDGHQSIGEPLPDGTIRLSQPGFTDIFRRKSP